MIKKIKNLVMSIALLGALGAPVIAPAVASAAADISQNLCSGSQFVITSGSGEACPESGSGSGISALLAKIVNIISAIVGVVAVIMIVVGGFKYITSGGDSNKVSGAKNTIIYAIIGLIIVALAQVIVHLVLNNVSGTTSDL